MIINKKWCLILLALIFAVASFFKYVMPANAALTTNPLYVAVDTNNNIHTLNTLPNGLMDTYNSATNQLTKNVKVKTFTNGTGWVYQSLSDTLAWVFYVDNLNGWGVNIGTSINLYSNYGVPNISFVSGAVNLDLASSMTLLRFVVLKSNLSSLDNAGAVAWINAKISAIGEPIIFMYEYATPQVIDLIPGGYKLISEIDYTSGFYDGLDFYDGLHNQVTAFYPSTGSFTVNNNEYLANYPLDTFYIDYNAPVAGSYTLSLDFYFDNFDMTYFLVYKNDTPIGVRGYPSETLYENNWYSLSITMNDLPVGNGQYRILIVPNGFGYGTGDYIKFRNVRFTYGAQYFPAYEEGFTDGYQDGLTDGYEPAYNDGYDVGLSDGYQPAYNDGFDAGLVNENNVSYQLGFGEGFNQLGFIGFISKVFNAVNSVLQLEIFPNFRLWYLVGLPLVFGVIMFFKKMLD